MTSEIPQRVKISQIVKNQLPEFLFDTVTTTNELITNSARLSATYVRENDRVVITSFDHQLTQNTRLAVEFVSGSGTSGYYSVREVLNANQFTIQDSIAGSTSGTVNYSISTGILNEELITIRSQPNSHDRFAAFLRQYYISQEFQGGPVDLIDGLNQYLKLDNLVPEVVVNETTLTSDIGSLDPTVFVANTKGFPDSYGLFKIGDEIFTYLSKTENSFQNCTRGFSGIVAYSDNLIESELQFSTSDAQTHNTGDKVENLSVLFLNEFLKSIKYSLVPGLENTPFTPELNVGNFLKEARGLYETKGTEESFKILFRILYGEECKVIDLEQFLIKPSTSIYLRREVAVAFAISGNPLELKGKNIFRSDDLNVTASVSDVSPITRGSETFYKIFLFVGYDENETSIVGNFNVTNNTKCTKTITLDTVTEKVVDVDSTIGFPESGTFNVGTSTVTYNDKTVNQFLGCKSISGELTINSTENLFGQNTYFGYEDLDRTKKIILGMTGVLSSFRPKNDKGFIENQEIFVRNIGQVIANPINRLPTHTEIFYNSWIYNTNCRFQIFTPSITGNQFDLQTIIDNSSLRVGDNIEILERQTQLVVPGLENVTITNIFGFTVSTNSPIEPIILDIENPLDPGVTVIREDYDIRRIPFKTSTVPGSKASISYGNDQILSDVTNTYIDEGENTAYVASNSFPEYQIDGNIYTYQIIGLDDFNFETEKYGRVVFSEPVSYLDGNILKYLTTDQSIIGFTTTNVYYVGDFSDDRLSARLYNSAILVGTSNYAEFGSIDEEIPSGTHFTYWAQQQDSKIVAPKTLKKFNLSPDLSDDSFIETPVGSVGMLVNGVEIQGYKTNDKIFYGPIENFRVLNPGTGYDVINPPLMEVNSGDAKIEPVIIGSIEKIYVTPSTFSSNQSVKINVSGGNGQGVVLEPVVRETQKEFLFDARQIINGGGIDINQETISFTSEHNFFTGQEIIYDSNKNSQLGIGSFQESNLFTGETLVDNNNYFAEVINPSTIRLYNSLTDIVSGINTIGITTAGNSGIHKFKIAGNSLTNIIVLDGGSGFSNRKLRVKPTGISSIFNYVTFENHGFSDGETIVYSCEDIGITSCSPISGISTNNQYKILKIDENRFSLADVGIAGTNSSNYERRKSVKFSDSGIGYQIFSYPPISLDVTYSVPGISTEFAIENIDIVPVVRGGIEEVYVYENGSDYGSIILNSKKTPTISIKNGKSAQFTAVIVDGTIVSVQVPFGGVDYYSFPDIVVSSPTGSGAILKPVLNSSNQIQSIVVINGGSGYQTNTTSIIAVSAGKNAQFDIGIRALTLNNSYKFGSFEQNTGPTDFYRLKASEIINAFNPTDDIQYSVAGYSKKISNTFDDNGLEHSPIIGWANDGLPIYGPYGYTDPENINSPIKRLEPGYEEIPVENRPPGFDSQFFVDDFVFTGNGDLDKFNGRYCKTPEYPNGIYAYFATIQDDLIQNSTTGKFPYFVGEYYRAFTKNDDIINQNFDFSSKNILRNTKPYLVSELFAGNDFITESNELISQKSIIKSVNTGNIIGFTILDPGNNYKINENILFDENDIGFLGRVSSIKGKPISSLSVNTEIYPNSVLEWRKDGVSIHTNTYFNLEENDTITISNLDESIFSLNGSHTIGVQTSFSKLVEILPQESVTGIVTTVQLNNIPNIAKSGGFIKIENEICEILNIYPSLSAIKIKRAATSPQYSANTSVDFLPNIITIDKQVAFFESKVNDIVYFNPVESIGIGTTTGITTNVGFYINGTFYSQSVSTQSIFIPDHPFKHGQKVLFEKETSDLFLTARNEEGGISFNIPSSGNFEELYVINKSTNFIGLVTSVGLTTTSNGVYFTASGSNSGLYRLKTDYSQLTSEVKLIEGTVVTTEPHDLLDNDNIILNIKGSKTGVAYSDILVKYNTINDSLLLNEENISIGINTITNTIDIIDHQYSTGQKIFYDSSDILIQGLSTGAYFVLKNDENSFKLCETFIDSTSTVPRTISLGSSAGSGHIISEINPKISIYRNRNLVFDLSDSSLSGFEFNLYYDNKFNKEFIDDQTDNTFNISKTGVEGSPGATLSLEFSESLPSRLFYNVKSGPFISTADTSNPDFCKIEYIDSEYNRQVKVYNAFGVGSTTFNFSLPVFPEISLYNSINTDVLEYATTTSKTAKGPIDNVSIVSNINTYKKAPEFFKILSENGEGANIVAVSTNIGSIKNVDVSINGFAYPSDVTLRPTASIPYDVVLQNSQIISNVNIINSGNNYITEPDIIVINSETSEVYSESILTSVLSGSTIGEIQVIVTPKGLPKSNIQVKAINNTNGVSISQVLSSSSGIVTCILQTPLSGFSTDPFTTGDLVFIEGITSTGGDGFNSSDFNYQFFEIINYVVSSNPGRFEYDISNLTSNPGIADTFQNSFATVVNSINYPILEPILTPSVFFLGETLTVIRNKIQLTTDLEVKENNGATLKLLGSFLLEIGDKILGNSSSSTAIIKSINLTTGVYDIAAYSPQKIGWTNNIGHLNDFTQVIADNDYYQNLSYSVKSNQEWDEIISPVNSLLHTSGLKNFSDTQIVNTIKVGLPATVTEAVNSSLSIINSYISEQRVDSINYFDLGKDSNLVSVAAT